MWRGCRLCSSGSPESHCLLVHCVHRGGGWRDGKRDRGKEIGVEGGGGERNDAGREDYIQYNINPHIRMHICILVRGRIMGGSKEKVC